MPSRLASNRGLVAFAVCGGALAVAGAASALMRGAGAPFVIVMVLGGVFALWGIAALGARRCRRISP